MAGYPPPLTPEEQARERSLAWDAIEKGFELHFTATMRGRRWFLVSRPPEDEELDDVELAKIEKIHGGLIFSLEALEDEIRGLPERPKPASMGARSWPTFGV